MDIAARKISQIGLCCVLIRLGINTFANEYSPHDVSTSLPIPSVCHRKVADNHFHAAAGRPIDLRMSAPIPRIVGMWRCIGDSDLRDGRNSVASPCATAWAGAQSQLFISRAALQCPVPAVLPVVTLVGLATSASTRDFLQRHARSIVIAVGCAGFLGQ